MDHKAQTSIEVLVLIGGVIVIATAVGLYLKGISRQALERASQEASEAVGAT